MSTTVEIQDKSELYRQGNKTVLILRLRPEVFSEMRYTTCVILCTTYNIIFFCLFLVLLLNTNTYTENKVNQMIPLQREQ